MPVNSPGAEDMRQIGFDFQWSKDAAGYKIQSLEPPPKVEPPVELVGPFGRPAIPAIIGLRAQGGGFRAGRWLVPRGGREILWRPLAPSDPLYFSFAGLRVDDGAQVEAWAKRNGPLGYGAGEAMPDPVPIPGAEPLDYWGANVERMRAFLDAWESGELAHLVQDERAIGWGRAHASLEWSSEAGAPVLIARPINLLAAMWWEAGTAVTAGAVLRRCGNCDARFVVGGGTKKRSNANYCGDACMRQADRAARRIAAQAAASGLPRAVGKAHHLRRRRR